MTPKAPAFEAAAASSAVPMRIMPPQIIGASMPKSSVNLVFMVVSSRRLRAPICSLVPFMTQPVAVGKPACARLREGMVIPGGFEPPAPRLGIWCSIRLSYGTTGTRLAQNRRDLKLGNGEGGPMAGLGGAYSGAYGGRLFGTLMAHI